MIYLWRIDDITVYLWQWAVTRVKSGPDRICSVLYITNHHDHCKWIICASGNLVTNDHLYVTQMIFAISKFSFYIIFIQYYTIYMYVCACVWWSEVTNCCNRNSYLGMLWGIRSNLMMDYFFDKGSSQNYIPQPGHVALNNTRCFPTDKVTSFQYSDTFADLPCGVNCWVLFPFRVGDLIPTICSYIDQSPNEGSLIETQPDDIPYAMRIKLWHALYRYL